MKREIERFELASKWIVEAGQMALFYYHKTLDYKQKKDGSLVTQADLEIETFLRKKIQLHFPEDNIIGEEFDDLNKEYSSYTWTVDPIDGTFSFAHKLPLFGNLIGLLKDKKPIMGLIYCPTLEEGLFTLENYESYWYHNGKKHSFECVYRENFDETILSSSGVELIKTKKTKRFYSSLLEHIPFERSLGDCYGHLLVATGRLDFMFDARLKIWDYVPLVPNLKAGKGNLFIVNTYSDKSIAAVSCHLSYQNFIKYLKNT